MLANELASARIRVNTVHPTGVDTPMLAGHGSASTERIDRQPRRRVHLPQLPTGRAWSTPTTSPTAVLYLSSDESRYVTGITLTVDAGSAAR